MHLEPRHNAGWQDGWKKPADTDTEARPPGCVWKHSKTGGYYWTLRSDLVPAALRGTARYTKVPLVAVGGRPVATRQREIALRCQRRLWRQWHEHAATEPARHVLDWVDAFADYNRLQAAARHVTYNCRIVRRLLDAARLTSVRQLEARHIDDYLSALHREGMAARTVQAHRNAIGKFCRFLMRRGVLDANPAACVDVAAPDRTPPRYLDDAQIIRTLDHLCQAMPPWAFDGVLLAVYSGGRLSSLRALRCEHVQANAVIMPLTKVGDYAVLPLDEPIIGPELGRVARTIRGDRPGAAPLLAVHNPRHWGEVLARATEPLEGFGELAGTRAGNQWHLLRSTWAVNCARRGATLWQLMQWGGWRVPSTVTRYVHIARAAGMDRRGSV